MKKSVLSLFVVYLALVTVPIFALNDDVIVWENMYRVAQNDEQRLDVVRKITEYNDREFIPVLVSALKNLTATQIESGNVQEKYARNQLARMLVNELGKQKAVEADDLVYQVYREVREPVLKGDAAVSLGKMQATEYVGYLSADLVSINVSPVPAISRNQEIIATALVKSLAEMRALEGYEAVFLASVGWYSYSSPVKELARTAILEMVDDPSDSLMQILERNPDIEIKHVALDTAFKSSASNQKKVEMASRALRIGLDRHVNDAASKAALSRFRISSLSAFSHFQDHNPENVEYLIEVVRRDRNDDVTLTETLNAYAALGVNGSDPAAKFIAERLTRLNEIQKLKANTARDKSLVRQLIKSAAATKNPIVKKALQQVGRVDHDSNITRLAATALKDF